MLLGAVHKPMRVHRKLPYFDIKYHQFTHLYFHFIIFDWFETTSIPHSKRPSLCSSTSELSYSLKLGHCQIFDNFVNYSHWDYTDLFMQWSETTSIPRSKRPSPCSSTFANTTSTTTSGSFGQMTMVSSSSPICGTCSRASMKMSQWVNSVFINP